jgi:hypothetical protein
MNRSESLNNAYPVIQETLPKSSLGYNTNNQFPIFPPKMSDGRALIASYQPEAVVNQKLLKDTGITSNYEYRNYLTRNAKKIMEYNSIEACNDVGYYERFQDAPKTLDSNHAYLYSNSADSRPVLGVQTTDLKSLYLSREQLEARREPVVKTQEEILRSIT